jgi:glycosyltransferase involved in cell wall biosynthesis
MRRLNLIAPVNQLGFGQFATAFLRQAAAGGADVALWPVGPVECRPQDAALVQSAAGRAQAYDPDAPCLRVWHPFDMAQSVGRGLRCGYTFFETTRLRPVEKHHLGCLDRVFVASRWAKGVLAANGLDAGRVAVAPPGVDASVFHPGVARAALPRPAGPDTTVFLNCGKWEYRKGHDAVAAAFNAAFEPGDDVLLVMNCTNPCLPAEKSREWEQFFTRSKMGRAGRVHCLPERLPTQDHVAALMAAADCGFFPARAEGWNMEAAEMLAMGKEVVLTDYSAHTEFAGPAGGRLVPARHLEEAFDGVWFKGDVGDWARLDDDALAVAVEHLRQVHRLRREGPLPANEKGVRLFADRLTWANCVRAVAEGMA